MDWLSPKERQRAYREKHKERLRAARLARYHADPEKALVTVRRWREKNRDYFKKYGQDHRAHLRELERARYHANPEKFLLKAKKDRPRARVRNRQTGRQRKIDLVMRMGGVCMDCGISGHPAIFHFDHRDPSTKKIEVGRLLDGKRMSRVLEEVAKCDLVCANCHAVRTWGASAREDWRVMWRRNEIRKRGGKCSDCGRTGHDSSFHFDHRDRSTKVGNISALLRKGVLRVVEKEALKCDLVCANCHATRTWGKVV